MVRLTKALGAAAVLAGLLAAPLMASAAPVTVADTYYGGKNTYNNNPPVSGDVIGTSVFDIQSATFERIGVGGSTLRATINTNYAGAPGTGPALGTGYGDLFLTPGINAWSPTGTGPAYSTDIYQPGDWAYAFTIPFAPNTTTGSGNLYNTTNGVIDQSHVGMSYSGSNFRNFQAVRFISNVGAPTAGSGTWTVDSANKKIVFDIVDNHVLGNDFAFSWAMTCANDIIQGNVSLVPEPSTWALLIGGFGVTGMMLRRRRSIAA